MATPNVAETISEASNQKFPAADANAELNPGLNKTVQVDPISGEVATSLEIKEQIEAAEKEKKEREKNDAMQKLKTTIIISGVIVAVAGAIFAITKKLKLNSSDKWS